MSIFNCRVVREIPIQIIVNSGNFIAFVVLKIREKERREVISEDVFMWYLKNYTYEHETIPNVFDRYTLMEQKTNYRQHE